jgi:hypothetical protein
MGPEEEVKEIDDCAMLSPLMMMRMKMIAIIACYICDSMHIIWRIQDICTKFGNVGHYWTKAEIRNGRHLS